MQSRDTWHSRYSAGDRASVWNELRQAGDRVRTPELQRARQNIDVIIERLEEQGYVFHTNDDARTPVSPLYPPGPGVEELHHWLTQHFDAVPMTLIAWLRLVGDVWLVGTHPEWPQSSSADPLVIEIEGSRYPDDSIIDYFDEEVACHKELHEGGLHPPFQLPVAPDRLHKENVSGGPPYGFILPDGCADGFFSAELTVPFVSYLQWVFGHGGFPVPTASEAELRIKRLLAADLLPL